jgi:hypothetical protein
MRGDSGHFGRSAARVRRLETYLHRARVDSQIRLFFRDPWDVPTPEYNIIAALEPEYSNISNPIRVTVFLGQVHFNLKFGSRSQGRQVTNHS